MKAEQLSKAFAALADPIRRDIVAQLATADATVGELAAPHDVSKQAVAKHLAVLEDAGLVSRPGEGHRRPAHLEAEVFDLMTGWIERYRREADDRYRRLDRLLRELPDEHSDDTTRPSAARPSTTRPSTTRPTTPRRRRSAS